MISDERLGEIVDFAESFGRHPKLDECASMAKELQAYRKAFSEPVGCAWMQNGVLVNCLKRNPMTGDYSISYWSDKGFSSEPLYRKPTIPEQEI